MNQYEMKKLAYQSNLRNRALQVLLYLIDRANKEQTCSCGEDDCKRVTYQCIYSETCYAGTCRIRICDKREPVSRK